MVVGLTLGVGLAFFLEYLDNTVKLPEEIKSFFHIPYLGPIPAFATNKDYDGIPPDLVTVHSPKSGASESFRGLRTGILFSSADSAPQVILVSSSSPEEGKTICASNLAITLALGSKTDVNESDAGKDSSRVVLLDCDMRRPRIHQIFDTRRINGISNYLAGTEALKNTIVRTPVANLDIMPSGPIPPNPSEILGSRKMGDLIEALKKEYARIVIDSPPVTAVTDALVLAPLADGVILVIRAGDTPRQHVQNGLTQLKSVNARVLGAVLNGIDTGRDGYYDYQYYYYYYGDDDQKTKPPKRKNRSNASY
jgi:capsular exopolysaccharide synthesis family protein